MNSIVCTLVKWRRFGFHLFLMSGSVWKETESTSHTISSLIKPQIPFVDPGAVSTSCHRLGCPAQGSCCPAGDTDRAAEAGGQTYKYLFNWNPHGEWQPISSCTTKPLKCSVTHPVWFYITYCVTAKSMLQFSIWCVRTFYYFAMLFFLKVEVTLSWFLFERMVNKAAFCVAALWTEKKPWRWNVAGLAFVQACHFRYW